MPDNSGNATTERRRSHPRTVRAVTNSSGIFWSWSCWPLAFTSCAIIFSINRG